VLRTTFIALSNNKRLRAWSEHSSLGRRLSGRFVAGTTLEEGIAAAERINRQGMRATLDSLGENVATPEAAERAAEIYHQLLDGIHQRGLRANVSLKLTQMGMDLDPALAERVVGGLVEHAGRVGSFVRVDMEGSAYTEATLALVERLHQPGSSLRVGAVIQSYLRRSAADVGRLLQQGISIRLCKGAYKEPAEIAFPAKSDVDANYIQLMQRMLMSGVYCGLATHDEAIVRQARAFAEKKGIARKAFEFQMLYGVRRDLQKQLVEDGYRVRVYIPFGTEWYPYFMRRLAERPANAIFIAKNMLKGKG
jgi:proline dehydrogenase